MSKCSIVGAEAVVGFTLDTADLRKTTVFHMDP